MTTSERRRLRDIAEQFPAAREALLSLAGPRRSVKAAKKERLAAKKESRGERNERMAAIRDAVFSRAGFHCEAWLEPLTVRPYRCPNAPAAIDHWLGGVGRRQSEESVETCWALCWTCNGHRTHNRPDAEWWNASFKQHCKVKGVPFVPHYDARAASRTTAVQPTPSPQTRRDRVTKASEGSAL